ncbi:MAG: sigma-70 family RNA polymerase sigma factor [Thermoleophilia bacterium]
MRLVRQGDARAFEQLVDRYRDPLSRYCRGVTGHAQDAEEAFQTTLIKAYQAIRRGDRVTSLRPWLLAIARNACLDLIRQRPDWQTLTTEQAARGDDPGDMQVTRERFEGLRRDLADLKELHRSALLLRELNGMSHREIGDALGTSPESAKRLIFEARESLVERAAGRELDCADVRARISEHDGRMLRSRRLRAHLDECACCAEYRATLVNRPRQLAAMFPVIPAVAAARILKGLGLGLGGGAAAGSGGLTALVGSVGGGSFLGGLSVQTAAILGVLTIGGATVVPGMVVADRPTSGVSGTKMEAQPQLDITSMGAHRLLTGAAIERIQASGPGSMTLLTASGRATPAAPGAQEQAAPPVAAPAVDPVPAAAPQGATTQDPPAPLTAPVEPASTPASGPAEEPQKTHGPSGGTPPGQVRRTETPAGAHPDQGSSPATRADGNTAGVGAAPGRRVARGNPHRGGAAEAPVDDPPATTSPTPPPAEPAEPVAPPVTTPETETPNPAAPGRSGSRAGPRPPARCVPGTPPSPPSGVEDTGSRPSPPAVTPAPVPSGPESAPSPSQPGPPPGKGPSTSPPPSKGKAPKGKVPGTGKGEHGASGHHKGHHGCHSHDGGSADED